MILGLVGVGLRTRRSFGIVVDIFFVCGDSSDFFFLFEVHRVLNQNSVHSGCNPIGGGM
jgi:hypothetical protein